MAKPKPLFETIPRPWNEFQVASRLNHGVEWFRQNRHELEVEGFPLKDSLLGGWDSKAIELWMDRRSGLDLPTANDAENELLRVIRARAS